MTPKEKAIELVDKFQEISGHIRFSKAYALIAVNEIILATIDDWSHSPFWDKVKAEIESL